MELLRSINFGSSFKALLSAVPIVLDKRFKEMNGVGREDFNEHLIKEQEASVCVEVELSKQPSVSNVRKQISEEGTMRVAPSRQQPKSNGVAISKEEEEKLALAEEREKRAAAAERRIAAMKNEGKTAVSSRDTKGLANHLFCSFCNASLEGKIPFHRYHYKYCSTSCMHVHREVLEDG